MMNLNLIPSVSRSGGLQGDGDELKKYNVQNEYLEWLQAKLREYFKEYPISSHISEIRTESQQNVQSNILILFRKLREGLIASQRYDSLTIEVYETSFYLSIIFRSSSQTTSIGSQLVPQRHGEKSIYGMHAEFFSSERTPSKPSKHANKVRQGAEAYGPLNAAAKSDILDGNISTKCKVNPVILESNMAFVTTLYLLNTLTNFHPIQAAFHNELRCILHSSQKLGHNFQTMYGALAWLQSLASALVALNHVLIEKLTQQDSIKRLFEVLKHPEFREREEDFDLEVGSLLCLLENLRAKMRQTRWQTMRSAYRELDSTLSAEWIQRSLLLKSTSAKTAIVVEKWLLERGDEEVQKKNGLEGRWILRRA